MQLPTAALAVAAHEVITKGVPTVVGVGRNGAAHTIADRILLRTVRPEQVTPLTAGLLRL